MNDKPIDTGRIAREKAAYVYSSALEQGDFDRVADILAQAEQDPELERMLLEINRAQQRELEQQQAHQQVQNAFKRTRRPRSSRLLEWWHKLIARWPIIRPVAWGGLGVALALIVIQVVAPIFRLDIPSAASAPFQDSYNTARHSNYASPREDEVTSFSAVDDGTVRRAATIDPGMYESTFNSTTNGTEFHYYAMSATKPQANAPSLVTAPAQPQALPADRMIARSGSIEMTVTDTRQARADIQNLVNGMATEGAFVVSAVEYETSAEMQPAIAMQLRIPVARFDSTIQGVAGMALRVINRSEVAQDVTEEYHDLDTKLQSLETARLRLVELLGNAGKVTDLLEVEKQLTERETEIESIKGRMQYLQGTAVLSSLTVTLYPDTLQQPIPQGWRPQESVRLAYEQFVRNLQRFVDWLIYFSIVRLPWLAGIGLIAWVAWRIIRRTRKKKAAG